MDDSLFGLPTSTNEEVDRKPEAIRSEQKGAIRAAFNQLGIESQEERQSIVESCVFRNVASLSDLTAVEARRVLNRARELATARPLGGGTAWDSREGDTWIDKM